MVTYRDDIDSRVRTAAFAWLADRRRELGDEPFPRALLADGFAFEGRRVSFVGPQGIFKPAVLPTMPLSIATKAPVPGKEPPYRDEITEAGLLRYAYRGTDPEHHENRALREAMRTQTPLVYVFGVRPGFYMPVWPVRIVGDNPATLTFDVDLEPGVPLAAEAASPAAAIRAYARREAVVRLHQRAFRSNVLDAYATTCAVCRLKIKALLDASHIVPDGEQNGEPIVPNGLALCKIHHAAFDAHILGARPDYTVEIRTDILEATDGPMLRYGLQSAHDTKLVLPHSRAAYPDPERLEWRYEERFRKAS